MGMLAWEEEEESDSDGGAKSESDFEPYSKELLENLEKILAFEEAEEGLDWRCRGRCRRPSICHTWHWRSAMMRTKPTGVCTPTGGTSGD